MAQIAYWIAHPDSTWPGTPTGAQIAAGNLSSGSAADYSGSETAPGSGSGTITEATAVAGLTASTAYRIAWVVYDDVALTYSNVVVGTESTLAASSASIAIGFAVRQAASQQVATGFAVRAAGSTSVGAGYAVRASGLASVGAGYAVASAGSAAVDIGYAVRAASSASVAAGYAVRSADAAQVAIGYAVDAPLGVGSAALPVGYAVRASGSAELPTGFAVRSAGQTSVATGFAVRFSGFGDLPAGYAILEGGQAILAAGYAVRSAGLATLGLGYAVEGASGTADPAAVWSYVLSNGLTAEQNLVQVHAWLSELHLIHGLRAGSPLTVTEVARTAGAISQSVAESGGSVTVERL